MEMKIERFLKNILIGLALIMLNFSIIFSSVDVNSYDYLKLKINNNVEFGLNFEKDYKISFIEVDSYFFPKTINNSQY